MPSRRCAWAWPPGCSSGNDTLRLAVFLAALYGRKAARAVATAVRERPLLFGVFVLIFAVLATTADFWSLTARQLPAVPAAVWWLLPAAALAGAAALFRRLWSRFLRTVSPGEHGLLAGNPAAPRSGKRPAVPYWLAYYAGVPALWGPLVLFAFLATSDQAAGAEGRLAASGPVIAQLWPFVFGLFWMTALSEIPRRFFRMARTSFGVFVMLHALPPLAATLALLATPYGTPVNLLTAAAWFFYGLAWERPHLLHFVLFAVATALWFSAGVTVVSLLAGTVAAAALTFRSHDVVQKGSLL